MKASAIPANRSAPRRCRVARKVRSSRPRSEVSVLLRSRAGDGRHRRRRRSRPRCGPRATGRGRRPEGLLHLTQRWHKRPHARRAPAGFAPWRARPEAPQAAGCRCPTRSCRAAVARERRSNSSQTGSSTRARVVVDQDGRPSISRTARGRRGGTRRSRRSGSLRSRSRRSHDGGRWDVDVVDVERCAAGPARISATNSHSGMVRKRIGGRVSTRPRLAGGAVLAIRHVATTEASPV